MSCRVVLLCAVWSLLAAGTGSAPVYAEVDELKPGLWSGGGGVGFLANTPDGAAEFGFNGHADYFLTSRVSVGPLVQYAGVGNDFLFGLSAQAKYWWAVPGSDNRVKLVVQGGVGFMRAGIKDSDGSGTADTYGSFVIPIGIGLDYAVSPRLALTADVLINISSLGATVRVAGREFDQHTNVLPGVYLGVRF